MTDSTKAYPTKKKKKKLKNKIYLFINMDNN